MDLHNDFLTSPASGQFESNINGVIEMKCYQALQKIKAVIEDDSLGDKECFMEIEEIISVLESTGSCDGFRHGYR